MRRFILLRVEDESGVSGCGVVAEGCAFTNGLVALTWRGEVSKMVTHLSVEDVLKLHSHDGRTRLHFIDGAAGRPPRRWTTDPPTEPGAYLLRRDERVTFAQVVWERELDGEVLAPVHGPDGESLPPEDAQLRVRFDGERTGLKVVDTGDVALLEPADYQESIAIESILPGTEWSYLNTWLQAAESSP